MNSWIEKHLDNPGDLGIFRYWIDKYFVRPRLLQPGVIEVFNRERLPESGPVIFVANHESLVDAVVIQLCYPLEMLSRIRPTGSRDFFKRKGTVQYFMAGFMMRLCFIEQGSGEAAKRGEKDPFAALHKPLKQSNMLIYFPQGTRGNRKAEVPFTTGIFHLSRQHPGVPIIPVLLRGTEKLHPKGVHFLKFFTEHSVRMYVGLPWQFDYSDTPHANVHRLQEYIFGLEHNV